MDINSGCVWHLLWDHDPNGLVAVDLDMKIRIVNPAFCRMFRTTAEEVIGTPASRLLGDVSDFMQVWQEDSVLRIENEFPEYGFYVREMIFPIHSENIVACVMVDLTEEWSQKNEIHKLQRETIEKVNEVVDNQMKVAQEIAGLLGETTAETKASLLKLVSMIEQGNIALG